MNCMCASVEFHFQLFYYQFNRFKKVNEMFSVCIIFHGAYILASCRFCFSYFLPAMTIMICTSTHTRIYIHPFYIKDIRTNDDTKLQKYHKLCEGKHNKMKNRRKLKRQKMDMGKKKNINIAI